MTRMIAIAAVLVAGACTTAMNWSFSFQLGTTTWDSFTWATFSVALDVTKWLMLPFAAIAWPNQKLRSVAALAIWLVATVYSFTAAIGFAALNRETAIAERAAQIETQNMLVMMRQSPRWRSTAACADATAVLSKQFCARYAEVAAKLDRAAPVSDSQTILLTRLTGLSPDRTRIALAIFLAIACEVISALGLFAILAPPSPPQSKKIATHWTPPKWRPLPAKRIG